MSIDSALLVAFRCWPNANVEHCTHEVPKDTKRYPNLNGHDECEEPLHEDYTTLTVKPD